MTELRLGSKLTRQTAAVIQRRELIATLHPGYLELRRKGTRTPFGISYDAIYTYAAKLAADRARAEKKARRKEKR